VIYGAVETKLTRQAIIPAKAVMTKFFLMDFLVN